VIVQEEDLGNYTCHAVNKLGWAEGTIMVSGLVSTVKIHLGNF
jgi:hypothetical protein